MTIDTEHMSDFELPRHSIAEECCDEYEEVYQDDGQVMRHDVTPSSTSTECLTPMPMTAETFKDACKVQTFFTEEGRKVTHMKARKSAWVHNIIRLNGEKFDFTGRDYLLPIYDGASKEVLLCTGRQVEKSSYLANNLSIMSSIIPFFKCLYVSPSHAQTRQFSNEKLKTVIEGSPLIRRYLQDNRVSSQVFEKSFTNGSFIFLRSAFLSADRCLDEDTEVTLPSGSRKKIKDLDLLEPVLSKEGNRHSVESVLEKVCVGQKPALLIELANGPSLISSMNHKFDTYRGTKRADELCPEDFLPIPMNFIPDAPPNFDADITTVPVQFIPEKRFESRTDLIRILKVLFYKKGLTEVEFRTDSETLARGVHYGLQGLGIYSVISFERQEALYTVKITQLFVKKFYDTLNFISEKERYFLWVPIKQIRQVPPRNMYDIAISNTELFVANGVVTHNSRGISADILCCDELQDLLINNIPVIAQCLSHSKYGYQLFTGTPKSFDNTIQIYWETSTMNEWMVPCSHCSGLTGRRWNFLDHKNIGKNGPICKYCGSPLNVAVGQWQKAKNSRLQGYRIPQLMVPWIAGNPEQWSKLLYNYEHYPESQFFNEILGLSYDNASKPITRADVLNNCRSNLKFLDPDLLTPNSKDLLLARKLILFAGIDWGEGNDGAGTDIMGKIRTASYTVLTIGGFVGDKRFRVVFMKRYTGREIDPDFIISDIVKICQKLGVKMIGTDWGHGWGVNNRLFRLYGPKRCIQFMYVEKQKQVRKWDPIGFKMQLMRNHVMSEIFYQFKEGMYLFPPLDQWESFAKDMFNISVEYIEYRRQIRYVHRPSDPDDWFHSLLYCKQVAEIYYGKRTSE